MIERDGMGEGSGVQKSLKQTLLHSTDKLDQLSSINSETDRQTDRQTKVLLLLYAVCTSVKRRHDEYVGILDLIICTQPYIHTHTHTTLYTQTQTVYYTNKTGSSTECIVLQKKAGLVLGSNLVYSGWEFSLQLDNQSITTRNRMFYFMWSLR